MRPCSFGGLDDDLPQAPSCSLKYAVVHGRPCQWLPCHPASDQLILLRGPKKKPSGEVLVAPPQTYVPYNAQVRGSRVRTGTGSSRVCKGRGTRPPRTSKLVSPPVEFSQHLEKCSRTLPEAMSWVAWGAVLLISGHTPLVRRVLGSAATGPDPWLLPRQIWEIRSRWGVLGSGHRARASLGHLEAPGLLSNCLAPVT